MAVRETPNHCPPHGLTRSSLIHCTLDIKLVPFEVERGVRGEGWGARARPRSQSGMGTWWVAPAYIPP